MPPSRKRRTTSKPMPKSDLSALLWIFPALILIHFLGSLFPTRLTWGFNFWALVTSPWRYFLPMLGMILTLPPVTLKISPFIGKLFDGIIGLFSRINKIVLVIFFSVILLVGFFELRVFAHIYGDGLITIKRFFDPTMYLPFSEYFMKPLAVPFHLHLVQLVASWPYAPSTKVAGVIVIGGMFGFWALYRIAYLLGGEDHRGRWFILAACLTSACFILFLGYVEYYTWPISISLWTLAFTIGYYQDRHPAWLPILTGVVAVLFHIFSLPFLVVAGLTILHKRGTIKPDQFKTINLAALGLSFLVALLFQIVSLHNYLLPVWPGKNVVYWLLSFYHLVDVFNEMLLVAPIGGLVALLTAVRKSNTGSDKDNLSQLLFTLSLFTFLISFWIIPELGAPRDWDVLGFYGFPLTIWGAYQLTRWRPNFFATTKALFPVLILALVLLGPNLYEKKNMERAVHRLDSFLTDDPLYTPEYKEGYRCLKWGQMLLHFPDTEGMAQKYFIRRLEAIPEDVYALMEMGRIAARKKQNRQAVNYFYRILNQGKVNHEVFYELSLVEDELGLVDSAYRHASAAAQLKPDNPEIQTQCAILLLSLKRPREALPYFKKAHELSPKNFALTENLGVIYGGLHMDDSALVYLEQAMDMRGGLPLKDNSYVLLFYCAFDAGKAELARKALKELERHYPDNKDLPNLKKYIQNLKK